MEKFEELDAMKAQLEILNRKLQNEKIVNDKLIRRAMTGKVSTLNRQQLVMTIINVAIIPYWLYVFAHIVSVSWAFNAFTILFLLTALVYNIYYQRIGLKEREVMTESPIEVSRHTVRMKQLYYKWLCRVGIPFLCVWIPWFFFEVWCNVGDIEYMLGLMIGALVGAIIGGVLGWKYYRNTMKTYNEILQQIDELSNE